MDWVVIGFVAYGAVSGYRRGLIGMVFSLAVTVFALSLAARDYPSLAAFLNSKLNLAGQLSSAMAPVSGVVPLVQTVGPAVQSVENAISFGIILFAVEIPARFVLGMGLGRMRLPVGQTFNRTLGFVGGGAQSLLLLAMTLLVLWPVMNHGLLAFLSPQVHRSFFAPLIWRWVSHSTWVHHWLGRASALGL